MKRGHNIQGTRFYLLCAGGLLLLSAWAVKDGWFPAEATLAKHPPGEDSFYLFNKVLAVVCGVGSVICGYIHSIVK